MTSEQTSSAPSPQTTLIITLGASQYPDDPIEFPPHKAFEQAAEKIEKYFANSFGIPKENILQLFNTDRNAIEIGKEIYKHLEKVKGSVRDVIVYYVGHAKRTRRYNQLYLAIKDTRKHDPEGTSLKIESLARIVWTQTRALRRFYILDCCFAANALQDLQGPSETDLLRDTFDEVENEAQGYTALFSSSISEASVILPDDTNTFFTEALLSVLSEGDPYLDTYLSFKDISNMINIRLNILYKKYLSSHSGLQRPPYVQVYLGNIAGIPIFPNPAKFGKGNDGDDSIAAPYEKFIYRRTIKGHEMQVNSVAISPDGSVIVSGSDDCTIKGWKLSTGELLYILKEHKDSVNSVAISPDGSVIVSGSDDEKIKIWDLHSGKLLRTLKGHSAAVWCVAISPDGGKVVSGGWDNSIKIWNLHTGELLRSLVNGMSAVYAVAISSDGNTIVSGDEGSALKIWSLDTGKSHSPEGRHLDSILSVAISPNRQTIVSGSGHYPDDNTIFDSHTISRDGSIKIWDMSTGKLLDTLVEHMPWNVNSIAISPNGQTMVSGSHDQTVRTWSLDTGKQLQVLTDVTKDARHSAPVWAVAMSHDGKTIISGGWDRTIKIWQRQ